MTQNCNCHGSGGQYSQTVAAVLERPRYSPGLILEDSDLTSAVDYTQALSRLLFRNLFGCGVICGLTVEIDTDCGLNVTVLPGLALDGCGDPVQLPGPVTIAFDKEKAKQISKGGSAFWVTLCGKEKLCQPRALVCEADDYDGVTQATRIRAMSEVSISFEEPECICRVPKAGPDAPPPPPAEGAPACAEDCGCGTACDCGCCLLLASASFGDGKWTLQHEGVRRLVRPAMVADRDPNALPPAPPLPQKVQAEPSGEEKIVEQPVSAEPEATTGGPLAAPEIVLTPPDAVAADKPPQ